MPANLKDARRAAGLSQVQLARKVGRSQGYVSLLECGRRRPAARLTRRLARVLGLPPTALPMNADHRRLSRRGDSRVAHELAALGYPGFAYLGGAATPVNPAEVLLRTLAAERVDPRLLEAGPWLLLRFAGFDHDRTVSLARGGNIQNRLGFVVDLAKRVAQTNPAFTERLPELNALLSALEPYRLAREDDLGQRFRTEKLRNWVREHLSEAARHWNILTDLDVQHLAYAD